MHRQVFLTNLIVVDLVVVTTHVTLLGNGLSMVQQHIVVCLKFHNVRVILVFHQLRTTQLSGTGLRAGQILTGTLAVGTLQVVHVWIHRVGICRVRLHNRSVSHTVTASSKHRKHHKQQTHQQSVLLKEFQSLFHCSQI